MSKKRMRTTFKVRMPDGKTVKIRGTHLELSLDGSIGICDDNLFPPPRGRMLPSQGGAVIIKPPPMFPPPNSPRAEVLERIAERAQTLLDEGSLVRAPGERVAYAFVVPIGVHDDLADAFGDLTLLDEDA